MTNIDKIADRIKKLLAVANSDGATEAERDTAMQMAQGMMAKYNLDEADLPGAQQEPRTLEEMMMSGDTWLRSVGGSVARLFFCKYYFVRSGVAGRDIHKFAGKDSNVITSLCMFEYLVKNLKKEASKKYRSVTSPEGRSFCVGAADSIRKRVLEIIESEKNEAVAGRELVLKSLYERELQENMDFLRSLGIYLKQANRKTKIDPDSFNSGVTHGKTVGLNRQINTAGSGHYTAIGR